MAVVAALVGLALAGCQRGGADRPETSDTTEQLIQRQARLELQLQQLEQRLNRLPSGPAVGANNNRAPAGVVKSLTLRTGSDDDRLRIYWADGTVSDLPCTKEQTTLACG